MMIFLAFSRLLKWNLLGRIVNLFVSNNVNIEFLKEKVHIVIGIVDNFCHEVVYHKHKEIDYTIMEKQVVSIIVNILK